MCLRQQLGRADVEEEAGEDREHRAEHLIGHRDQQADDHAEHRRERDVRHPSVGLRAREAAGEQQAHDADPVREAVDDDDRRDHQPEPAADGERRRQRNAVEEAVEAHAGRADDPDVTVRRLAVLQLGGRLVADVEGGELLDGVEGEEADGGRDHRGVEAAVHVVDRLGDEVEEGRPDPDAGADRDDEAHLPRGAEGEDTTGEGGREGAERDEDGGEGHRRSVQDRSR